MADYTGFARLDPRFTAIIGGWVAALEAELPAVMSWWHELQERLDSDGTVRSRAHWPAGPASHPRVLAIFRDFYFQVHEVNVEISLEDERGDPSGEDAWMSGPVEESAGPVAPAELLIDMMESYAPDLYATMRLLVFIPVGEDDDSNPV